MDLAIQHGHVAYVTKAMRRNPRSRRQYSTSRSHSHRSRPDLASSREASWTSERSSDSLHLRGRDAIYRQTVFRPRQRSCRSLPFPTATDRSLAEPRQRIWSMKRFLRDGHVHENGSGCAEDSHTFHSVACPNSFLRTPAVSAGVRLTLSRRSLVTFQLLPHDISAGQASYHG